MRPRVLRLISAPIFRENGVMSNFRPIFHDRRDAGKKLGQLLLAYAGKPDILVLALPRGGVPVAYEVALALNAPLSIFEVRKLGVPGHKELAMGAIASGGMTLLNEDIIATQNVSREELLYTLAKEQRELERLERAYGDGQHSKVTEKTVILVDDGLATGASMLVAIAALRLRRPAELIVAVPVATSQICRSLRKEADDVICYLSTGAIDGISAWYEDFRQLTDNDVRSLLRRAAE